MRTRPFWPGFVAFLSLCCRSASPAGEPAVAPPPGAVEPSGALSAAQRTASSAAHGAPLVADPPKQCDACEAWNQLREPFRVYGNTYFVGTGGLSAVLVVGTGGSVLLDGGLSQSAPLIASNIEKLGFRLDEVRLIVNSHTHYDHAGGIAALQRASGAKVYASPASQRALARGEPTPDDPQFGFGHESNAFPPIGDVQVVRDGQTLHAGGVAITARFTPGHTPGGTSWVWRSCEGQTCLDIVYADSLTAISAPGYRYSESDAEGLRVVTFRESIARVASFPCDILLAPHPGFLDLDAKLEAQQREPSTNPFIDRGACQAYAAGALERLQQRLAEERSGG